MEADTIVAVATPPGEGGVGIVRMSGDLSATVGNRLFAELDNRWPSHTMRYGNLLDPQENTVVDRALGCLMRGPSSYTGEDVFEIHCHGSPMVLERVTEFCLNEGCRAARPGEFTLRAFLNGRLDLSQAEAVLDTVRARSNDGLALAVRQLTGQLSRRVNPFREELVQLLAQMEAMVDFVEEDVPPQLSEEKRSRLHQISEAIDGLVQGAEQGIVLRDGATLAIVGSPNVGKSSILNGLLGLDRSIVTSVPGTTRDTIEETLKVRGIPFRSIDTAGITETQDPVEAVGIQRSREALQHADVVLFVVDGSREWSREDELVLQAIEATGASRNGSGARVVLTINKSDLGQKLDAGPAVERLSPTEVTSSSTVDLDGLDSLRAALERSALGGSREEVLVGNVRHRDALQGARDSVQTAISGFESGIPLDLISFDVRQAVQSLGEITGASVDDELLDRIFRDFCIGK